MADESARRESLFGTWIHAFEDDTPRGAVYRSQGSTFALSRRPRERIELSRDGSARLSGGGPDDRLTGTAARWDEEGEVIVVRGEDGAELRIVERSPERLIVEKRN